MTRIGAFDGTAFLESITPDGTTLFISAKPANDARFDIYRLALAGESTGPPTEVPVPSSPSTVHAVVAPNGLWIAYTTGGAGQDGEVNVQSVEPGGGRAQASKGGGGQPHWSRDGRDLYFGRDNEMFAVSVDQGSALALD